MKAYKKFMNIVVKIEGVILNISLVLALVLTFGNVVARKIFQHSWGFTEEIVVAVFVLLSLLGAGIAARDEGGLVNLGLIPELVKPKTNKVLKVISTIISLIYSIILTVEGINRVIVDETATPILHIPKAYFWVFVVVGGISLILHLIENCIDFLHESDAQIQSTKEELK